MSSDGDLVGQINFAPRGDPPIFRHICRCTPSPYKRKQALIQELIQRAERMEELSETLRWQGNDESADTMLLLADMSRMDAKKVEKL